MLRIYLARHGQDEDNLNGMLNGRSDRPLTKLGEKQAQDLAVKIGEGGIVFDKVYTSPLKRAGKTAEIIAEYLHLPKSKVDEDLVEKDFGRMTGKLIASIPELCAPDILKSEGGGGVFP